VKARPLSALSAGDRVYFYATLDAPGDPADWMAAEWGTYLIGEFTLARDPVDGDAFADLSHAEREAYAGNAHLKRDPFDAAVLLVGDDGSRLYDRAVPLSGARGVDANHVVTEWSADSGRGRGGADRCATTRTAPGIFGSGSGGKTTPRALTLTWLATVGRCMLELYQSEGCPHSQKARETLSELGVSYVAHNPVCPATRAAT